MNDLVPFHAAVAGARAQHRLVITWAQQWGRTSGKLFDPDLLALVLAAAAGWFNPRPVAAWTRRSVYHVLRCDVPNWCSVNRCLWPEGVPETLWGWLHFLAATGGLTEADEPLSDLLKPLLCYGWLDFEGRPRPEDSSPLIPCECFEPLLPEELAELELRGDRGHGSAHG
ncbi:MAG: hypothetical protein ABR608_02645 [Pseudonocardiaceae bacterium]